MGIGGISVWQLLIILAVVVLVFGTKRLREFGGDFGGFIRGMRGAAKELEHIDEPEKEHE